MALMLPPGAKLVAATHNPGKARELGELLSGRFDVVSAGSLGLPEPDETETTFVGNALLKARAAADASGLIALADDSGLSVTALDASDDRAAWFTCALAVAWPSGPAVVVEGRVDGDLTFPGRGTQGFGYDPIFIPQGHDTTFGEMAPAQKDGMSHRARAFEMLRAALF